MEKSLPVIEEKLSHLDKEELLKHFVSAELDSGKIILQKKILIDKNETENSLKEKILKQEHKLYPQSIISIFK